MNAILNALLTAFKNNPKLAVGLITQALQLLKAAPATFVLMLPEGEFKEWAKKNEAQAVTTTESLVGILTSDPALLTALISQFGPRK